VPGALPFHFQAMITMPSKPRNEYGWTLVEAVIVIVLIGILSAIGGNLVLSPIQGYLINSASEQALSAPQSAVWQIRRDYAMTRANGAAIAGCTLTLNTINGQVIYAWSQPGMTRNNALLLSRVTATTCPFSLTLSGGRTLLNLSFTYLGTGGQASVPVSLALSSFEP
jgi:type II secretory pathway pseudopilin PulG